MCIAVSGAWIAAAGGVVFVLSVMMIALGILLYYVSDAGTTAVWIASRGGLGMLVFLALMIAFVFSFQTEKLGLSTPLQVLVDLAAVVIAVSLMLLSVRGSVYRKPETQTEPTGSASHEHDDE